MAFEAFYLPVSAGRRFCLFHPASDAGTHHGAVVYVHPFAEEMNKSRRMAALQAKAMAAAGYSVLQIDLHGCGDSSGDFGDATWDTWIDDVTLAWTWLHERCADAPWLWGLRTGCLLACAAATRIAAPSRLLLWQPVVSGKQFLQQFLRLRLSGEMLAGEGKGQMDRMREQLARGESLEIAGYSLSPGLASGLERAELTLAPQSARIEWIDLSGRPDASLSPMANARIAAWKSAGRQGRGRLICGPAFWQTAEISECPDLIAATMAAMADASSQ